MAKEAIVLPEDGLQSPHVLFAAPASSMLRHLCSTLRTLPAGSPTTGPHNVRSDALDDVRGTAHRAQQQEPRPRPATTKPVRTAPFTLYYYY